MTPTMSTSTIRARAFSFVNGPTRNNRDDENTCVLRGLGGVQSNQLRYIRKYAREKKKLETVDAYTIPSHPPPFSPLLSLFSFLSHKKKRNLSLHSSIPPAFALAPCSSSPLLVRPHAPTRMGHTYS